MALGGTSNAVLQLVAEEASSWAWHALGSVPDGLVGTGLTFLSGLVEDGCAVGALASSIHQGIRAFLGAIFVG